MSNSKIMKKIKSPFVKHFESFLVPDNNRKQNLEDSFTNKCLLPAVMGINQYVLMKSLVSFLRHTYLGKDGVYNFINSMIRESKYCSEVIKKAF